jgi:hypothetical protein
VRSIACAAALAAVLVACAPRPSRVRVRPSSRDERNVAFLPFASSQVERFSDAQGQPCPRFAGHVHNNLLGWESSTPDDAACTHDTHYEGLPPGVLEMHWRSQIAEDGSYDLVTLGYSVGAWGRVVGRGAHYGDSWSRAKLVVEARSTHCEADWSLELALTKVSGPQTRQADFSGWVEIPELLLKSCKAREVVDVRLRLVGESNRGRIDVDWFGFSALADEEVNRIFGLRPRAEGAAARTPTSQ